MTNKFKRWLYDNLRVTPRDVTSCQQQPDTTMAKASNESLNDRGARDLGADSLDEVRQLVSTSVDDYDEDDDTDLARVGEMLGRAALLPQAMRTKEIIASSPLVDHRRLSLFAKAAKLDEANAAFLKELGTTRDVPAILSAFRVDGVSRTFAIVRGLRFLNQAQLRQSDSSPHDLLLQLGMFEAVYEWVDLTGDLPEGPFDPDAEFCGPGNASGAEFVYRVLIHAKWDCTRDDVMRNLPAVNRQVSILRFGEEE